MNNTPTNTARTELHSMFTLHHANTRGASAHSSGLLVSLKKLSSTCHVSFLAAPDTVHLQKYSLTHLSYLSNDLTDTHTRLLVHDEYLPCDVPRQCGGSTQIPLSQVMSPTSSRPKQSILNTSSPEELSLTGILGQIRIKYKKDL